MHENKYKNNADLFDLKLEFTSSLIPIWFVVDSSILNNTVR